MNQDLLAAAAVRRLETASATGGDTGYGVTVVLGDPEPATYLLATIAFALAVPADRGDAWHRTFTRTVFLAGRPASVAGRHRPDLAAPGLSWHGPAPAAELDTLGRLLRVFHGPRPVEVGDLLLTVPGPPTGHTVTAAVATLGVRWQDWFVHTHHLFAEATLRGLIRPGDTVRCAHRAEIGDPLDPADDDLVQTRITHDRDHPGRLRLYGLLRSDRRGRN